MEKGFEGQNKLSDVGVFLLHVSLFPGEDERKAQGEGMRLRDMVKVKGKEKGG